MTHYRATPNNTPSISHDPRSLAAGPSGNSKIAESLLAISFSTVFEAATFDHDLCYKMQLLSDEEQKTEDSNKMKARLHPESVLTRDDEAETNGNENDGTNELSGNHESEDQTVYTNPPNHNLTESTTGSSDKVSVTLNLEMTTISPNETLSHDVTTGHVTTDVTIAVNPKILTPQGSSSLILKVSFPLLILTVLMR